MITRSIFFSDTVGLNEGERGTVPHQKAVRKIIDFARNHEKGFNLIVLVTRKGRISSNFEKNHLIFYKTLYSEEIPCILYVSGCEHDEPMDQWYTTNEKHFTVFGFAAVVCGTTLKKNGEADNILEPLRVQTRNNMWKAIRKHSLSERVAITPLFSLRQKILNIIWNFFTDKPYCDVANARELKKVLLSRGMTEEDIAEIFA